MSVTFNYFFNHSDDLPDLAKNINAWLGCSLSPYEGNTQDWFCRFLSMEFDLFKHDLENDGECDFEDYKYELRFRIPVPDGDLRTLALPTLALSAYTLFHRMRIVGMLVFDVQILLAKYAERLKPESNELEIYDTVSAEFVNFPAHFETLQKRLPKSVF
jgi:hypothetical protein